MDAYAASSNRRYPTGGSGLTGVPTTAKLRMNVSSLSNLSNNKGQSKPRASSASLSRRNNARYEAPNTPLLGGSGSFSAAQQAQILRGGSSFSGLDGEGNPKNGNYISSNPSNSLGGGAFAGDAKGESYDQIRRNYEHSKFLNAHKSQYGTNAATESNNNNNTSNNNTYVGLPRAQSASNMSRAANSYTNNSNAYLAMRQNTQVYNSGLGSGNNSGNNSGTNSGTNTPPPEFANGAGGGTSFGASGGKSNPLPAGLAKFGGSTRGIANGSIVNTIGGGAYTYNSALGGATTVGSLLALGSNPNSPRQSRSSTEILPPNFVPTPILAAKSSYSATSKGVNRVASHNKRVSFSTPLTNSTPLLNPFMCQGYTESSNTSSNGRYGGSNSNSSNSGNGGLSRPASASAALMSTATTHYHNNTHKHTPNVVINNGVVLTGATVVANISSSRSESPINGALNSGIPSISAINSLLQSGANANTQAGANTNAPNMNKPPLFLSTIGSNQYESGIIRPNAQNGVASPKPEQIKTFTSFDSTSPVNTHSIHTHTTHAHTHNAHATHGANNNLHNTFSTSRSNSGDTNDTSLPTIRTPSPRPGSASSIPGLNTSTSNSSNSSNSTTSTTNHTTNNTANTNNTNNATTNNSAANNTTFTTLQPLFTPTTNSKNTKGMVMSNSMENFASFGLNNTTHTNTQPTHSASTGSMGNASVSASYSGSGSTSGGDNSSISINGNSVAKVTRANSSTFNPTNATPPTTNNTASTNNTTNNTTNTNNTSTNTTTTPQLRRKNSTESLSEMAFMRITPPTLHPQHTTLQLHTTKPTLSPKNSIRDDSVLLLARKEGTLESVSSNGTNTTTSKKTKKRPSLSEQLAHIGANSNSTGSTSTINTSTSGTSASNTPTNQNTIQLAQGIQNMSNKDTSFFQQSLNSAIAIGRSVVTNVQSISGSPVSLSGKHFNSANNVNSTSSNSLQSLINNIANNTTNNNTNATTPANTTNATSTSRTTSPSPYEISDNEESITGSGSSIVSVPCKAFSIGTYACRNPTKMMFYTEHCEYPFHHPYENSTVILSIPYRDMSSITTVGMKFRFKIPRKVSLSLGDFDVNNALHLVTLELNNTSGMSSVRERVVPLVTAK